MVYFNGQLSQGKFIRRLNRFVAEIDTDNGVSLCHVPNTGRMEELFCPGAVVILRGSQSPSRRTGYDILAVLTKEGWMAVDSRLPNKLVREGVLGGHLTDFHQVTAIKDEVTFGKSRFDLYLEDTHGNWLIENKCCTLVAHGIARFPDAPTERGTRHMLELAQAAAHGFCTAVFFIVQCDYAAVFTPNDQMDPAFGLALRQAQKAGTRVYAYNCSVSQTGIRLLERIPVDMK